MPDGCRKFYPIKCKYSGAMNGKIPVMLFIIIILFVAVSGCTDMYNALKSVVPTTTPTSAPHVNIGDAAPSSSIKGVTITGQGNTIIISGHGPYNVMTQNDSFTLNQGNASVSIDLKSQSAGCSIGLDYTNPYSGSAELLALHQFTMDSRLYKVTKDVYVPYSCKYCLMVNYAGDWEVRITQE